MDPDLKSLRFGLKWQKCPNHKDQNGSLLFFFPKTEPKTETDIYYNGELMTNCITSCQSSGVGGPLIKRERF
ncbi:hypothetical protein HanIR_Chr12g0576971 [Helianthus annuus]|nr:hypothetical protein HanIR_Chr12g0576971 [Helianthus annuus]